MGRDESLESIKMQALSKKSESGVQNLAFYKFVTVTDPQALRDQLDILCERCGLLGTIIVAEEGINAMLAGEATGCQAFLKELEEDQKLGELADLSDLPVKISLSDKPPFGKLRVKVKPEIVTMRVGTVALERPTAEHLAPETFRDWLRAGEEMVVIDTRNDYEYSLGSFRGALNPETRAFHEFPDYLRAHRQDLDGRKVVMFCTGGIRCEKATRWMLQEGFEDIYQLDGGVLRYFEQIPDAHRDWDGELFVFDGRVAVKTTLEEAPTQLCPDCGQPHDDAN